MGKIRNELKKVCENSNNNEAIVAEFLLNYQGDFRELKAIYVIEECFVSIATVTRLSKTVGLHGFNELKIYLYEESVKDKITATKYQGSDSTDYFTEVANVCETMKNDVNEKQLDNVINLINCSTKVNLYSQGGTNVLCQDFYYKLNRLNINCTSFPDYHMQTVQSKNSNNSTLAIGVSYSGLTVEVLDNLNVSKQNGAATVLLTANTDVAKYDFIDHLIIVPETESFYRNFSITSRFSMHVIFDILYIKLINSNYSKYSNILQQTKYFN